MWHRSFIPWTPSLLAIVLVATTGLLAADDSSSDGGYKTITVKTGPGGKPVTLRVRDNPDALAHASFPDELDHQRAFSATNDMASKTFSLSGEANAGNSAYKDDHPSGFVTKPYSFDSNAPSAPGLDRKTDVSSNGAFSKSATGFDKTFSTSKTDTAQDRTALLASSTSSDQGRTAVLGGQVSTSSESYPSSMSNKPFNGAEADAFHHALSRNKDGQILVSDLPDRPLTVDEVRDLINHGFRPNTSAPPPEASRPLNDPGYVPQPLRDTPQPDTTPSEAPKALPAIFGDDDKFDAVPSPGTMAAPPENTQPLPQP